MLEARNKRSIIHKDSLSPGSGSLQPADLVGAAEVHQQLGLLLLLEPKEGDEDVEVVVTLLHPVHRSNNLAEEIQHQREEIQCQKEEIQCQRDNILFTREEIQFPKEEIQHQEKKNIARIAKRCPENITSVVKCVKLLLAKVLKKY